MSKLTKTQIAEIEAKLRELPEPDLTDPDNPEWTAEDFAKATGPESLSDVELAAFPRTRGRPKNPRAKVLVTLRLSPEVLDHYKSLGAGWQAKVNETLRAAMGGE